MTILTEKILTEIDLISDKISTLQQERLSLLKRCGNDYPPRLTEINCLISQFEDLKKNLNDPTTN